MLHNPCGHGPYIGQSRREKKDISIFTVWAGRWMQWPQNTNASVREISNRMGKGCNGRSSTRGCSRHQCTLRLDHIQRVLKNSCWLRESWVSFLSVQSLSPVRFFATPWTAACQASLSITNSLNLLKSHVHWVSDAIQPSHPLSSPSPAFNLSQHQGLFQWVTSSNQEAKVLELQL